MSKKISIKPISLIRSGTITIPPEVEEKVEAWISGENPNDQVGSTKQKANSSTEQFKTDESTVRLNLNISKVLHKELKMRCAARHTTLTEYIKELIKLDLKN